MLLGRSGADACVVLAQRLYYLDKTHLAGVYHPKTTELSVAEEGCEHVQQI